MAIQLLFQEPAIFFAWVLAIFYGITVHEFAHAWAASWQGDDTAKEQGRLTLNPFSHVDMFGFIMLVFAGFGWGRPVPVNHYNLKYGKKSDNLISLAGIFFNIVSIIVFVIILKVLIAYTTLSPNNLLVNFIFMLIMINTVLAAFNLIPIPPLDGSHVLFNILPDKYNDFKLKLAQNGPWILLMLILADNFLNIGIFSRLFSGLLSFIYSLI